MKQSSSLAEDRYLAGVVFISIAASIASCAWFYSRGQTLSYPDAQAHLMIARRVFDSPTPGFAQLGGVWLPLPHILMLPFVWNSTLFYSGMAGSVVSMGAYVLTAACLYKIVLLITGDRNAAVIGALVFVGNPNVLYMQSTAMSELPLFMFIAASVLFLVQWSRNPSGLRNLIGLMCALLLATLTRYEGWVLAAVVLAAVGLICMRERFGREKTEAYLLYAGFISLLGIGLWLVWNQVIFGDALSFERGTYAKPSNWVGVGDKAVGSITTSFETYALAMSETIGVAILVLAAAGLVLYLVRARWAARHIAPIVLLFPIPFFVAALYQGLRPLHVVQVSGDLYNVRFGLVMVLACSVFAGYFAAAGSWAKILTIAAVIGIATTMFTRGTIVTLNEALAFGDQDNARVQTDAAAWLRANYDGGPLLAEAYGNERLLFDSHVPLENVVYEGSFRRWQPALDHPELGIEWIVMNDQPSGPDRVWAALKSNPMLADDYALVYQRDTTQIYRRIPPTVTRSHAHAEG